jgi:excinuclease ABC subunit A
MTKKNALFIRGAKGNNLKNVNLEIPYHQLVVVTGVSGSGKSSLTMDTLYAEGQRRYVESLSSYARQFLMRMKKPEVDNIEGLCPAIAIEQRVGNKNARSTVGTLTEIYDYLRLLFARVGRTFSPVSNQEVKKYAVSEVLGKILTFPAQTKLMLFAPMSLRPGQTMPQFLQFLLQKGYTRIQIKQELQKIEDLKSSDFNNSDPINVLIDRFVINPADEENNKRIADSIQTAFYESGGQCLIQDTQGQSWTFSNRFELDGLSFEDPTPQLFNFNSSLGACPTCEGYGQTLGIEEDKVIPDKNKSVFEEAVACWKGEKVGKWREYLLKVAHHFDFPVHRPYRELTEAQKRDLWDGNEYFEGIHAFFRQLEEDNYKIQNRVMLARYRGQTVCPSCKGTRLRKEALYIRVAGKTIAQLVKLPIDELMQFFQELPQALSPADWLIAKRLCTEVTTRLQFMLDVGLNYLNLDRLSASLSGGEIQRIHLTRTLGSNLSSSLYILDEPSIGLHPRDTARLVKVLRQLRDLGNTVVVVEHEEEIIANADYLVDVGPRAGIHGGEIIFAGQYKDIAQAAPESLTTQYLLGKMQVPVPKQRRQANQFLYIHGARQHNLKNIDVKIPLNIMTAVTGVSGSGKTTLIKQILYPALLEKVDKENSTKFQADFDGLSGDWQKITKVEFVNQQPIGKSSRSNPVTYVGAYDAIRKLFSDQQAAKIQGFKPKHFSFNVEGGRCETCKGDGEIIVSMQFLADVRLTCDDCQGKRFQKEVLEVQYKGKSIFDVLEMTIEEALDFFKEQKEIINRLKPLYDVGLGYIRLGQSSSTLSGGEAQRVKLASFLNAEYDRQHIFFIFDEPTTGLHFHDVRRLLDAFQSLIERGHTVLIIEHNLDVIKTADHVIDLGKEGGKNGGYLLFEGTPEGLAQCADSYTGQFLKEKLPS